MSIEMPAVVARLSRSARGQTEAEALLDKQTRRVHAGDQGLADGTIVIVDGRGHVTARLAEPGSARAELYGIVAQHGIDVVYPAEVTREVAAIAANPQLAEGTVDQTALPYVTIDNDSSRDLDQAVHIARDADGYVVRYALADASYYVRPGSALLDDALTRGTSYYLPGFSVPMLPRRLSEDLVSLNPEVTRRALVFCMHLDADARCQRVEIERARIRSRAKLTYPGVQAYYDRPKVSPLFMQPFSESLELLREVGEKRIERAEERDVVVYERRELDVDLSDARGSRFRARMRRRNDTERYNEQISLLCNTEGAKLLLAGSGNDSGSNGGANAQPIFRVHRPPPAERVERMRETVDAIVEAQGLSRELWCWRDERESLARYLARLPDDDDRTLRLRRAIEQQLRYVNQASRFESGAGPHHALGVQAYARFSSPMREVVGIVTHKEALEMLGQAPPGAAASDAELRDRAIEVANAAKKRQRAINKAANRLAIDQFLGDDLARPFAGRPARPATVMGLRGSRVYVELDDFAIELKVYTRDIEAMTGQRYAARGLALVPQGGDGEGDAPTFRVGDGVRLRTRGRDGAHDRWQLWPEPMRR